MNFPDWPQDSLPGGETAGSRIQTVSRNNDEKRMRSSDENGRGETESMSQKAQGCLLIFISSKNNMRGNPSAMKLEKLSTQPSFLKVE